MDDLIDENIDNIANGLSAPVEEYDSIDDMEVVPSVVSENEILYVVSDNGVTKDEFNILIEEVKGLREDVKNKQYSIVFSGVSANSVSDDQAISVSDNLIHKQLKDYNTSEGMALIGLILAFSALIIYMIHKTIFRIRR